MNMNEKKALYAFGCPSREATVKRLRMAAALSPDPATKKLFRMLAVKLCKKNADKWYPLFLLPPAAGNGHLLPSQGSP